MSKEITHSIILIIAIALTFVFPKTNLVQYDLQISALLFLFLFTVKRFIFPRESISRLLDSVIFTLVVLGIVNSTGAVGSPFFFLVYFLLFSLSLLLEPIISITTTSALVIFFLMSLSPNQDFKTLLPIFSLAFLTPFALFMSQQYEQNIKFKIQNTKLQEDTFLLLSLLIKNQIKTIKQAVENFMGDSELDIIRKSIHRMEKTIEKYEKQS